ncbi:UDP-N-acetylmuramate--L-alanine ligase [Pseudoclavibacter chungangensis]|uniref:UDP-N-acetylmuramate--L-alanine ligase n=1 Tax=Pseudoclavibacter chungangensis TaxID=587635 RepID=A0A7J5BZM0_9MICO|nr:UDP-N-acetylmuramate--L-alanine ligase [Pseudoclavibacter chungangensis]KAB1660109.1 UDP-N-acetylmuramate--L-alanine ligase [Pseudoclavibacter chungangensis]NYJ66786.1 UDP-N-acetylmuramate--alanine ligase [Pseudoclavibacter chungangensis]
MIQPDPDAQIPDELGKVHFIGIGGSGMSGIARMLMDRGVRVSGSDRTENDYTRELRERGAEVHIGHDAANLGDADTVVVTSALWPDNPELVLARERGLTVLHRSQALVWLTRGSRLVAVAGAHGKTTSTGMVVTALDELGADPSFVNGGVIEQLHTSSHIGGGREFVVEADESDGSFLFYDVAIALITNIDNDHLDHYGTVEAFEAAFVSFASRASEAVVISSDDPLAVEVTTRIDHPRIITFGEAEGATVRVSDIASQGGRTTFVVHHEGVAYPAEIHVPGRHNAINATGAFAVLTALGHDPRAALDGLAAFGGTKRRFELHGTVRGVSVYDDYAHHPAEVEAALTAARTVVGDGRLIAVHQPHLYSRTQAMSDVFAEVYERLADRTVVLDVCGAREDPIPGVTGALVADAFADPDRVAFRPDWQEAADYTASVAREGDFVITFGCGDVNLIVPQLLGSLEASAGA